jgi:Domain of unknown function (DUF4386)
LPSTTTVVLLFRALGGDTPTASLLAVVVGVIAGLVQVLGLLRYTCPGVGSDERRPECERCVTRRGDRHLPRLGAGVCEHLGYLLTGAWTALVGIVVIKGNDINPWLGWVALPIGVGLMIVSPEFLGPDEEKDWRLAGTAVPLLYIARSLWLLALGLALIA